jgi:hypothetical protein
MATEEGVLSLYRGYTAYMLAIVFWMSVLPVATDFIMNRMPLLGNQTKNEQLSKGKAQNNPYSNEEDEDDDDDW